jgi:hypothetical protein
MAESFDDLIQGAKKAVNKKVAVVPPWWHDVQKFAKKCEGLFGNTRVSLGEQKSMRQQAIRLRKDMQQRIRDVESQHADDLKAVGGK